MPPRMPRSVAAAPPPAGGDYSVEGALGTALASLPQAVLVIDGAGFIRFVNSAGEQLFDSSAPHLCGQRLDALIPADSTVCTLVFQALEHGSPVSEYGTVLESLRTGTRTVTAQVSPLVDRSGGVVLSLMEHTLAMKIGQQLAHRNAARSVTAMAALLAHEIKNPLSGIRGAAQLLETSAAPEDRTLTQLICDEADRIVKLVDRMEVFTDQRPLERDPVNIHQVMEHVRRVAENGFARHVRFTERYDPSLPPVWGHRDQLIQVFLNLVKNAAEACPQDNAEITLTTSYQHGIRVQLPGSGTMMNLPLVVTVQDNGEGIPEDLRPHLFDPFVTTKRTGSGLGLALVAKIISDHGGVIEFDSQPRRTVFKVMLPIVHTRAPALAWADFPGKSTEQ